jgi:hypothetical protein
MKKGCVHVNVIIYFLVHYLNRICLFSSCHKYQHDNETGGNKIKREKKLDFLLKKKEDFFLY